MYFRESSSGTLHSVQDAGASVIYPFQVAAERVAQPFEDAVGWAGDVLGAKSENEKLRAEVKRLRQQLVQSQTAVLQNAELRRLLRFRKGRPSRVTTTVWPPASSAAHRGSSSSRC